MIKNGKLLGLKCTGATEELVIKKFENTDHTFLYLKGLNKKGFIILSFCKVLVLMP